MAPAEALKRRRLEEEQNAALGTADGDEKIGNGPDPPGWIVLSTTTKWARDRAAARMGPP
jgi:hypothetical protein